MSERDEFVAEACRTPSTIPASGSPDSRPRAGSTGSPRGVAFEDRDRVFHRKVRGVGGSPATAERVRAGGVTQQRFGRSHDRRHVSGRGQRNRAGFGPHAIR